MGQLQNSMPLPSQAFQSALTAAAEHRFDTPEKTAVYSRF